MSTTGNIFGASWKCLEILLGMSFFTHINKTDPVKTGSTSLSAQNEHANDIHKSV
jgi:hypothetical protein